MSFLPPVQSHSPVASLFERRSEVALSTHIDLLRSLAQEKDLYPLLAFSIPEVPDKDTLFLELKGALKEALTVCTFDDPGTIARSRGIACGEYHLVKIIGEDYRPLQQSLETLQKRAEEDLLAGTELHEQRLEILARYEEASSPYRTDKSTFFKVTPDAARALCQILKETPAIDALILGCPFGPENSFGDDVAEILATELPKGRFSFLQIEGSFGDRGIKALVDQVPFLLTPNPVDPEDLHINGQYVSEKTNEELDAQLNSWFDKRCEENPSSIVNKRDPCVVM